MRFWQLISLFVISLNAYPMFKSSDCINSDFTAVAQRKGAFFGTLDYKFLITKKRCVISVEHKDILESHWDFDICREPVHLKVNQYFSQKVYIKKEDCFDKSKDTFCRKTKEFLSLIQQEGLINAKGERDTLSTEHGKVYCAFKILQKHLKDQSIFMMNNPSNPSLFSTADLMDVLPKTETIERKIEVVKEAVVEKTKEIKEDIQEGLSTALEKAGEKIEEAKEDLDSF